jgi:transcriptional regulator EpsA
MQTEGYHVATKRDQPPLFAFDSPNQVTTGAIFRNASLLDRLELESLMLNMDTSLRVHSSHQFFTWTQGLLQDLVKHELLICALRSAEPGSLHVDSFAAPSVEPMLFSDAFRQDTSLKPHLIKTWEESQFQPVVCQTGKTSPFANSAMAREFARIGTDIVVAHGTYDAYGKLASFFTFACSPGAIDPKQIYFVELIVPFLHMAWIRIGIDRPVESGGAGPVGAALLTPREQEILRWIHIGKSNIEIGTILAISPLTVKNHVQKILRKLNVRNRAQAVGKGLALRILSN